MQKFIALALCISAAFAAEKLVFEDNFDNFNLKTWQHEITLSGGGNWEFEMYWNNRTNSYVKDGVLNLVPTLTEDRIGPAHLRNGYTENLWGSTPADYCTANNFFGCQRTSGAGGNILNPIQSARVRTVDSFNFKYGRLEVKAKLPVGDWLWPAIWLLPEVNQYGMWPTSGEIDLMESRGNIGYPKEQGGGPESFGSTLHWGPSFAFNRFDMTHKVYTHDAGLLSDDFHTYGLKWTKDRLFTYIDDESKVVLDVDMSKQSFWERGQFPETMDNPWKGQGNAAPFDQKFFLVMNVAVGGTGGYFPDGVGGKPWSNHDSHSVNAFYNAKGAWYNTWSTEKSRMQIDSVKVWQDTPAGEEEIFTQ